MITEDTQMPRGTNIVILLAHKPLAILDKGKQFIILDPTKFLHFFKITIFKNFFLFFLKFIIYIQMLPIYPLTIAEVDWKHITFNTYVVKT